MSRPAASSFRSVDAVVGRYILIVGRSEVRAWARV